MDLFERMKDIFGGGAEVFCARVEIIDFRCVGIFGGGKIAIVSQQEIAIECGKFILEICGDSLALYRSESGEIYVSGDILSVEKKKTIKKD